MAEKFSEKEYLEKGWIKAWMLFEVQAGDEKACKESLAKHMKNLFSRKDIILIAEKTDDVNAIDPPEKLKAALERKGITQLYSQVTEVVFLVQDFESLTHAVINYAPTAVEIIAPDKLVLPMSKAQAALSNVADMMHKFAAAGIGGMVISGE